MAKKLTEEQRRRAVAAVGGTPYGETATPQALWEDDGQKAPQPEGRPPKLDSGLSADELRSGTDPNKHAPAPTVDPYRPALRALPPRDLSGLPDVKAVDEGLGEGAPEPGYQEQQGDRASLKAALTSPPGVHQTSAGTGIPRRQYVPVGPELDVRFGAAHRAAQAANFQLGQQATARLGLSEEQEHKNIADTLQLQHAKRRDDYARIAAHRRESQLQNAHMQIQRAEAAKKLSQDLHDRGKFWKNPFNVMSALATALMPLGGRVGPAEASKMIDDAVRADWEQRKYLADRDLTGLDSNISAYRQLVGEQEQADQIALLESDRMATEQLRIMGQRYKSKTARDRLQLILAERADADHERWANLIAKYTAPGKVTYKGSADDILRQSGLSGATPIDPRTGVAAADPTFLHDETGAPIPGAAAVIPGVGGRGMSAKSPLGQAAARHVFGRAGGGAAPATPAAPAAVVERVKSTGKPVQTSNGVAVMLPTGQVRTFDLPPLDDNILATIEKYVPGGSYEYQREVGRIRDEFVRGYERITNEVEARKLAADQDYARGMGKRMSTADMQAMMVAGAPGIGKDAAVLIPGVEALHNAAYTFKADVAKIESELYKRPDGGKATSPGTKLKSVLGLRRKIAMFQEACRAAKIDPNTMMPSAEGVMDPGAWRVFVTKAKRFLGEDLGGIVFDKSIPGKTGPQLQKAMEKLRGEIFAYYAERRRELAGAAMSDTELQNMDNMFANVHNFTQMRATFSRWADTMESEVGSIFDRYDGPAKIYALAKFNQDLGVRFSAKRMRGSALNPVRKRQ